MALVGQVDHTEEAFKGAREIKRLATKTSPLDQSDNVFS
jgi:hypothetical protein